MSTAGETERSSGSRGLASLLQGACEAYGNTIVKDPDFTSKLETGLRIASYLIPGKFGASWELSEVAYCISNLYSLGNDYIIAKKCPASCKISKCSSEQQRTLWVLSLMDCLEVGVEVLTQRFCGEPGKWGMVILMQAMRAWLRFLLVFRYKYGLVCSPPVPPLDRKAAQNLHVDHADGERQPQAWRAPRTGRVVRSIHADDSVPYSQLQHHVAPPSPPAAGQTADEADLVQGRGMPLTKKQLLAEALYLLKPLVHISSMFIFKQKSWKPWLIAFAMDMLSLQLLGSATGYVRRKERSEIMRRRILLFMYLLRSPFYDKHTKDRLLNFLNYLGAKLPLVKFIITPILEYLPVWQQTYSYNWST